MSLQNVFYLTNIIVMILAIILLVALVILVFVIMKKFTELANNISRRIDTVGRIIDDPVDVAAEMGAAMAEKGIQKIKKLIHNNT
jgi:uncharacterized membrane protein